MRAIDADALEKEGWSLHRDIQVDKNTSEYQTKPLRQVPTIVPQRKKGMWIEHNPHKWGLGIVFECSECGEKIDCEPSNFCPNCGAEMEGQDDRK
jgi:rubrerythrin